MATIGELFVNLRANTSDFTRGMAAAETSLNGVSQTSTHAQQRLLELNTASTRLGRTFGTHSQQAMNARNAVTEYALGLDDATFKQVYMKGKLGQTESAFNSQANSIKLNARMTRLMGDQTQILTRQMEGLQRHGIKPEMMLPPSTIGQFRLLNETMRAGNTPINMLSAGFRRFGNSMESTIKGWSAQKMAMKMAQGDMVKYGLLLRGITAGQANLAMAFPMVGMASMLAYGLMFAGALKADKKLKELAETVGKKVGKAFEPLIQTAGQFLGVILKMVGKVADLISKFNEAHPTIAKFASVILFLLPIMTLLFMPLNMGIGLLNGWKVAINGLWAVIGPLVTTIATASATFLVLAGIVALLVGAFIYLWNTNEGFKNACIAIWESIKSTIQTALEAIKQFFMAHADTIKAVLQVGYEAIKAVISTVMNGIGQIVSMILTSMTQFWQQHGDTIKSAIQIVYDTIKQIITSAINAISIIVKSILKTIETFWQQHGETIKSVAKASWDLVKTIIQGALKIIQSIILAVCSAINGDWKGFWNQIGNITKTAWSMICSVVTAGVQNIPKIISACASLAAGAMRNVMNAVVSAAKSFGSSLVEVGSHLISGLARGISAGAGAVVSAVSSAVSGAIATAKKALGINSPSRVFMQFGKYTGEGLAIGINGENKRVVKASRNLSESVIGGYSASLKGLTLKSSSASTNANSSKGDVNVIINSPKFLSPYEIRKQFEQSQRRMSLNI